MEFTVHQAKTQFSKLIAQVLAGEDVVITRGKERSKIARLVPFEEKKPIRVGWLKGQIPDVELDHPFFDPLPEDELRLWEGEEE